MMKDLLERVLEQLILMEKDGRFNADTEELMYPRDVYRQLCDQFGKGRGLGPLDADGYPAMLPFHLQNHTVFVREAMSGPVQERGAVAHLIEPIAMRIPTELMGQIEETMGHIETAIAKAKALAVYMQDDEHRCECGVEKAGGGIHSNWCPVRKQ